MLRIRVGVNSAPELDFLANSKSNSGIGIELELALPSPGGIGIARIGVGIAFFGITFMEFNQSINQNLFHINYNQVQHIHNNVERGK